MFDGFQAHCASKESDLVGALLQLLVDRQLPWLAAVFALGGCELDDVRAYVPKGDSRAELAAAAKVSLATVFGAAARLGLGGTAACAAVPGGSSSSPRRARASASRRRLDM